MQNARLDKAEDGIKISRRIINNLRYAYDTTVMAGSKEPVDESERWEWKRWLNTQHSKNEDHDIWSHHFMKTDGETIETVTGFIFLGADKGPYSESYGFTSSHEQLWELDNKKSWATEELMLSNCGAGEDSWQSLGYHEDQISHS